MGLATGFTAERMLEIERASIVDAHLEADDLVLTSRGGTDHNVGNVRGHKGDKGDTPSLSSLGITVPPAAINHLEGTSKNVDARFSEIENDISEIESNLSDLNTELTNADSALQARVVALEVDVANVKNTIDDIIAKRDYHSGELGISKYTAQAGWEISSGTFNIYGRQVCMTLTIKRTGANVSVPTNGNISNQNLVQIDEDFRPPTGTVAGCGSSGTMIGAYVSTAGYVTIGAVPGGTTMNTNDSFSVYSSWVLDHDPA